jgi:hypothetical protein
VPIVHEAGWASGTVWTGMEKNAAPIGGANPEPCSLERVAVPTELSRPVHNTTCVVYILRNLRAYPQGSSAALRLLPSPQTFASWDVFVLLNVMTCIDSVCRQQWM